MSKVADIFTGHAIKGVNDYNDAIKQSQANNLELQQMLLDQATGGGPNLAQQQFENATQQLQKQAAGQIGAIKGISPAAQARLLQQQQSGIAQDLAGEAAAQRMQQQLAAEQLLGQQSLGMFGASSGNKTAMETANAEAAGNAWGGLFNAAGGVGAKLLTKWEGGTVENEPTSELGRALMGLASGGPVFSADGGVPGTAAQAGDSPANDTVPALLSPGEVVIPRSIAQAPDAPERAASFVEALQRRQGKGYADVVAARMACGGVVKGKG